MAIGLARGLYDYAVARGADRAALAASAAIDPSTLNDPDARLPASRYVALMKAGQALTGDPSLALHFAEAVDLADLSIVGLITHACETMNDAFTQLARYDRLAADHGAGGGPRYQRLPGPAGTLWLVDARANPNAFPEATEGGFVRLVVGPRRFDPTPFCREVHFTHAEPAYSAEYHRIFRCPVVFGAERNAMLIEGWWADRKIAARGGYAFGVLAGHAEGLMTSLEETDTLRGRVEAALMSVLHTGEVGMAGVARRLGFSRQTLLRRLKAEGTTYEAVLDDLRRRLARDYLQARKVSVNETAYLVGFADPASFSRAYKRWTGRPPSEARIGPP